MSRIRAYDRLEALIVCLMGYQTWSRWPSQAGTHRSNSVLFASLGWLFSACFFLGAAELQGLLGYGLQALGSVGFLKKVLQLAAVDGELSSFEASRESCASLSLSVIAIFSFLKTAPGGKKSSLVTALVDLYFT